MDYKEKWEIFEVLGEGGQGKVFRVSNKIESIAVLNTIASYIKNLSAISTGESQKRDFKQFRQAIIKMLEFEDPSHQGALKVLHSIEDARDPDRANIRIKKEIEAMSKNLHPNLLEIIEVDEDLKWYVSKFYPNGSLDKNKSLFRGDLHSSLKAIRPIVEGVSKLHQEGYVHRDIKPHNVFLGSANQFVLGDFGLIYFSDNQRTRVSGTFENVGSRDWMPGWAYGVRLDEVKPSFDVFALGKLLWSMVAGEPILPLWYYRDESNNVEMIFPKANEMKLLNELFSKCIVEREGDCLPNATAFLEEIDQLIEKIELSVEPLDIKIHRKCKVCGVGFYKYVAVDNISEARNFGIRPVGSRVMRIFTCSHCGHVQLFSHEGIVPPAWADS